MSYIIVLRAASSELETVPKVCPLTTRNVFKPQKVFWVAVNIVQWEVKTRVQTFKLRF